MFVDLRSALLGELYDGFEKGDDLGMSGISGTSEIDSWVDAS
jgi:hypothetical protein